MRLPKVMARADALGGLPVVSRLKDVEAEAGAAIKVRLDEADPENRRIAFSIVA